MKKSIIVVGILFMSSQVFAGHGGDTDHSKHKQKVEKKVKVEIGKKGFKPQAPLNFKPNENIVLNITRTTEKTCMTELKNPRTGKLVELPLHKEIKFDLGSYNKPTEINLLCGMKMKAGTVYVKTKTSKI